MAANYDCVLYHGPSPSDRFHYYMKHMGSTHERICPLEIFTKDPSLGLRDVILMVIQKLKQNKKVVIDDDNGEQAKRNSFIKLINKKVPRKTIALLSIKPKYGLDQVMWAREYHRVESQRYGELYVSYSDHCIYNWFDPNDRNKQSYHFYNEPQESENFKILKIDWPLHICSKYQFEVPALFLEWDGMFSGKTPEKSFLSATREIFKQWLEISPWGQIIFIKFGFSAGGGENEYEDMVTKVKDLVKVTDKCVYLFYVSEPSKAGKYSRPPDPGVLAYLQKQHYLDLYNQNTLYMYQHVDHMNMAEKAGIKCAKISRILHNPSLVLSSHSTSTPRVPDFMKHLVIQPYPDGSKLALGASVPLYCSNADFSDHISVDLGHGYMEHLFSPNRKTLERFQETYSQNASCVGESSKMKSKNRTATGGVKSNENLNVSTHSANNTRGLPKWMLGKSNNLQKSNSELTSSTVESDRTGTSVKIRKTEYIMSEMELQEIAKEFLKQAGRDDLLHQINKERRTPVKCTALKQDSKLQKTKEVNSDSDFDIPPLVSSYTSNDYVLHQGNQTKKVEEKIRGQMSTPLKKLSVLDDFLDVSPIRKSSPKKNTSKRKSCNQTERSCKGNSQDAGPSTFNTEMAQKQKKIIQTTDNTTDQLFLASTSDWPLPRQHEQLSDSTNDDVSLPFTKYRANPNSGKHTISTLENNLTKSETSCQKGSHTPKKKTDLSVLDEIFS